jgi:hypothetical protein
MLKEEVFVELKKIGFCPYTPSDAVKEEGKSNFLWTYPIKDSTQWFSVKLVEDNGQYFVEAFSNEADKKFVSVNIKDFIQFIKSELINN